MNYKIKIAILGAFFTSFQVMADSNSYQVLQARFDAASAPALSAFDNFYVGTCYLTDGSIDTNHGDWTNSPNGVLVKGYSGSDGGIGTPNPVYKIFILTHSDATAYSLPLSQVDMDGTSDSAKSNWEIYSPAVMSNGTIEEQIEEVGGAVYRFRIDSNGLILAWGNGGTSDMCDLPLAPLAQ
jgi:hypothetical protein